MNTYNPKWAALSKLYKLNDLAFARRMVIKKL